MAILKSSSGPLPPSERACGVCDPTRPGRRGSQPENSKRARAPVLQTPPKFHEKTHRETQKERNGGGKRKKKREIFGPPPFGAPPFEAPPFGAKRSAQERPLVQQISHTEFHLERAKKRLGERSSSRTPPCPRCHGRLCASTSRVSRVRESSSVPPANGEPTPRRTGRTRSRAQGRHCGTSEGQTETFSIPQRRHNPSHAHSDSRRSQRLDAGSPRRLAGRDEWRQLRQGSRVDVHDVERRRKFGRDDRRHGTVTNVHRHSRYGLRGARVGEASNPGPRLLRRYPGAKGAARTLVDSDEEPLLHASRTISVSHSDLSTVPASHDARFALRDKQEVSTSCHHILDRGRQR